MRSALFASVLLVGCYQVHTPGGAPTRPLPDGGRPGDPRDAGPPVTGTACTTTLFLLGGWQLEEPRGSAALGLDLDGMVSTGAGSTCVDLTPDHTSIHTGTPGVDNAFATLVPTITMVTGGRLPTELYAEQVDRGTMLYALELVGVDDATNDPTIEVVVHRARALGALRSRGGLPDPGQAVALDRVASGPGSIVGGRVRASLSSFVLDFLPGPDVIPLLPLELRDPTLTFELDCGPGGTLRRGELGAGTTVEFLADQAERSMPGLGGTVRSVLEGVADLRPAPTDPTRCLEVSSGYGFEGVAATR